MNETDRPLTGERKLALLLQVLRGETTVADVCRAHGVARSEVEGWLKTLSVERARAAIQDEERRHQMIIDTIPTLAWRAAADGSAEFFNQRWRDYTGLSVEEAIGWRWTSALHPEDADRVAAQWGAILASGKPGELEARLRRADGQYRWFIFRAAPSLDDRGVVLEWYGTNTDIEDRKRAEETLKDSARELRLLVDSFPGMVAVASAEGRHEYANKRVMDYVRKGLSEVAGFGWMDDIHPDERDAVRAEWRRCVERGEPMDILHRWRRHDGVYRWIHSRTEPLLDAHGKILRWYALLIDVDDQRNAEEALRASQAELAHVTRVMTMGELTASIAHEVNQPLAAIVNNANACLALLPGTADLDEIRKAIGDIVEDADRAGSVISGVRQLVTKAPLARTLLDVGDLVSDVLALARHESAIRRVTICTELPDELPRVLGDRVQLQQVLLNLIVNGMDAMSGVDEAERVLTIRGRYEAGQGAPAPMLCVRDVGVGFRPGEIGRLFQPFYTTKAEGMGMGLAVSRSIIEAHGGRLWAEPNQGPGATFVVSLPGAGCASPAEGG